MHTNPSTTITLLVAFLLSAIAGFAQGLSLQNQAPGFLPAPEKNQTFGTTQEVKPASFDILDILEDLLDEPEYFEKGSSLISIGSALFANVNVDERAAELDQVDAAVLIPGIYLSYERQLIHNLGVGLTLGTQVWRVPVLNYRYRYYTAGLRTTYHFNIDAVEKLDPYIGFAGTYRRMFLTNKTRNESGEAKVSAHLIGGVRYYFTRKIGAHLEFGNDMTGRLKVGATFYFS